MGARVVEIPAARRHKMMIDMGLLSTIEQR
jgi:hypothetical protein